jgi:hypothetical protein
VSSTKSAKNSTSSKGKSGSKGRMGTYLTIGSTLFAAFNNIKKVRTARGEEDTLQLIDGLIRVAAVATGVALLIRELREAHDDDVLSS